MFHGTYASFAEKCYRAFSSQESLACEYRHNGSMDPEIRLVQEFVLWYLGILVFSTLCPAQPTMYVKRWPWRQGCCSACEEQNIWVLPCMICRAAVCEQCDLIQACSGCGQTVGICCKRDHELSCRVNALVFPTPKNSSAFPEWLGKKRYSLVCRHCNSMRDLAGHSCEICEGPACLGDGCKSALQTTHCCHKDVCTVCGRWVTEAGSRQFRCYACG